MGELGYDRKIEAVSRTASNSMPCKGLDRMSWHTALERRMPTVLFGIHMTTTDLQYLQGLGYVS